MKSQQIGRILLAISALGLSISFIKADVLDPTHIFNLAWPAHARFHAVMDVYVSVGIGLIVLLILWKFFAKSVALAIAALLLLLVETGFVVASLIVGPAGSAPPGTPTVLGTKPPVILAITFIVVTIIGYRLASNRTASQKSGSAVDKA